MLHIDPRRATQEFESTVQKEQADAAFVSLRQNHLLSVRLLQVGKAEVAEKHARIVLSGACSALNARHPLVLASQRSMVTSLARQGKANEGVALADTLVSRSREILGAKHPATVDALYELASLHVAAKEFDKAEPLLHEIDATYAEYFEPMQHPWSLLSSVLLSQVLAARGKLERAVPLMRKNLALSRELRGETSSETLVCMSNYSKMLAEQGKHAEASELLVEYVDACLKVDGCVTERCHNAALRLADSLEVQERYLEASRYLARHLGASHPRTQHVVRMAAAQRIGRKPLERAAAGSQQAVTAKVRMTS